MLKQAIAAGDEDLLSGAVARCRQLLAVTPPDDRESRPRTLGMLGVALQHRFTRHGAMADIDEAVEVGQRGADLVPEGDPHQVAMLIDLAVALRLRFEREGATLGRRDLDAAVTTLRRAVTVSRPGSSAAASIGLRLCMALSSRFDHYGDLADLAECVSVGKEVAAGLLADDQVHAAATLLRTAVERLAALPPGHLEPDDAELSLASFTGLASDAAALALLDRRAGQSDSDRAALAFRLLEAGRGSLLGQALGPAPRHVPGVPELAGLLRCSDADPVVAVNISRYRSDALVLSGAKVTCVPLPGLNPARLAGQLALLDRCLADGREAGASCEPSGPNRDLSGILEWLWDAVAWPVLEQLGYTEPAAGEKSLARIWWMPTGALCRLPLHAAGYHREGRGRTLLDRVVSSYTATVRALGESRDQSAIDLLVRNPASAEGVTGAAAGRLEVLVPVSAEPVHLTSALVFTGFGQVVGALWELGNGCGAEVSAVYRRHLRAQSRPARALREAVLGLRDSGRASIPLVWAGYVHAGG
jgi:hypothetical protein